MLEREYNQSKAAVEAALDYPELSLIGVTADGLSVVPKVPVGSCPFCDCYRIKPQNIYHRTILDYLNFGDGMVVTLDYAFHRYKCLDPDCGRVFSPPIEIARPRGRVTYRMERLIFNLVVLGGYGFSQINEEFLDGRLTRQSVYDIYNRYLREQLAADPSFLHEYVMEHDRNFDFLGYLRIYKYL